MGKLNRYKIFRIVIAVISSLLFAFMSLIAIYMILSPPSYVKYDIVAGALTIFFVSFYFISLGLLAYGFFRDKFWSIYVYLILLMGNYILYIVMTDGSHKGCDIGHTIYAADIIAVFGLILLPTIVGILLYKNANKILTK